jgi:hypothetical protein
MGVRKVNIVGTERCTDRFKMEPTGDRNLTFGLSGDRRINMVAAGNVQN